MNKTIIYGITGLNIFFLMLFPIQVKSLPGKTIEECNAALVAAEKRITEGRNIFVDLDAINLSVIYEDYPANRPVGYMFRMREKAAEDIMKSPQFMKAISTDIIQHCPTVGMVEFGVDKTDWFTIYGLIEEKNIEPFTCVASDNRRDPWGYATCL